jgi:hypothetical protein
MSRIKKTCKAQGDAGYYLFYPLSGQPTFTASTAGQQYQGNPNYNYQ